MSWLSEFLDWTKDRLSPGGAGSKDRNILGQEERDTGTVTGDADLTVPQALYGGEGYRHPAYSPFWDIFLSIFGQGSVGEPWDPNQPTTFPDPNDPDKEKRLRWQRLYDPGGKSDYVGQPGIPLSNFPNYGMPMPSMPTSETRQPEMNVGNALDPLRNMTSISPLERIPIQTLGIQKKKDPAGLIASQTPEADPFFQVKLANDQLGKALFNSFASFA